MLHRKWIFQGKTMAFFQVDRTQYPIGQGGFHSTEVTIERDIRLSMVIDCGGADVAHRDLLIGAFAESGKEHDILAISHLDADHINGLDQLRKAGITFDTVFLPHVPEKQYLRWMTLKVCAGVANVDEVVRILQAAGELYGGGYGPVVQVGKGTRDPAPKSNQQTDTVASSALREKLDANAYKSVEAARGNRRVFSCSQSLAVKDIDWLFRFYSREWTSPVEADAIWSLDLLAPLKALLDSNIGTVAGNNWSQFATNLKAALGAKVLATDAPQVMSLPGVTPGTSRFGKLQKLQRDIQSKGLSCKVVLGRLYEASESLANYNDASMCVYSGPAQRGSASPKKRFLRMIHEGQTAMNASNLDGALTREVGWVTTGDADLSTPARLNEFLRHYFRETAVTSVFVLPHHGSRYSFDKDLTLLEKLVARLIKQPLFIAPANPEHSYGHPHRCVESICRRAGDFYIVDQELSSYYQETLRSEVDPPAILLWR